MPRLLLIETLNEETHRHHRAEYFPYLLALADLVGWEARWWAAAVPSEHMHVGARYAVDIPPDARDEMGGKLVDWPPDVIVLHDRPSEALIDFFAATAPDANVRDVTGVSGDMVGLDDVARRLGLPAAPGPRNSLVSFLRLRVARRLGLPAAPGGAPEQLIDLERPRFDREPIAAVELEGLPVRLAGMPNCAYRRSLATNRFFSDFDDPRVRDHRGCSFCPMVKLDPPVFRTSPITRALTQIRAHQRSAVPSTGRFEYLFDDDGLVMRLGRFLEAVAELDLRPSNFITLIRADQILRWRDELTELLPRLDAAGHCLSLVSIGAENFSPVENERLNKGVTPEQIWECLDAMQEWERRFPNAFACPDPGYFATILFTPWTRPEDLRINILAARRLGVPWLNRALGTRLQLIHETPIVALARRDGLTGSRGGPHDDVTALCVSDPNLEEVPWRFADQRVARMHRLLVRLEPVANASTISDDDPLLLEIAAERGLLPADIGSDYVELALAIVDGVERLGPDAPVEEIFEPLRGDAPDTLLYRDAERRDAHRADAPVTPEIPELEFAEGRWGDVAVRVVHLSRATGEVVVSTGGRAEVVSGEIRFLSASYFLEISSAAPNLEVLAADTLDEVASTSAGFTPGGSYVAALIETQGERRLVLMTETPDVPEGQGALRVVCANDEIGRLDVFDITNRDDPIQLAAGISTGDITEPALVPAGPRTVGLDLGGTGDIDLRFRVHAKSGESADAFVTRGDGTRPIVVISWTGGELDLADTRTA